MRIDFAGKTVIVTGGGHGLGQEMCRVIQRSGAPGSGPAIWMPGSWRRPVPFVGGSCEVRVVDVRDRSGGSRLSWPRPPRQPGRWIFW